jgi:catechol 2,3-dioxygenase-like lactoylglutathione lyase family enzyme
MSGSQLFAVTLDCPDPRSLASFYRGFLGGHLTASNDDFVVLTLPGAAMRLDFQRVTNSAAAPWPSPTAARRLHLDFVVDDLDEREQRVSALGASRADSQPGGGRFRVMVDPAGHPFCLATVGAATTPALPVE